MLRRHKKAASSADHLMLVASVIDGLRRESSAMVDDATLLHFQRLSESLRRCAIGGISSAAGQKG